MTTDYHELPNPIRKAAMLICALDTKQADAILEKMGPEQASRVRDAVMQLGDIPKHEQDRAIQEFVQAGQIIPVGPSPGVEIDDSLAQKIAAPDSYEVPTPTPPESPKKPFQFLNDAGTDTLARHLCNEHPQVIAVVVAHVPPPRAADLIARLAPRLQADVLRRVAELDSADPDVISDIEQELETVLADELRVARNRSVGLVAVASILDAAGPKHGDLLHNLSQHDNELASVVAVPSCTTSADSDSYMASRMALARSEDRPRARLETQPLHETTEEPASTSSLPSPATPDVKEVDEPLVEFDELINANDRGLAILLHNADPQIALLALTGAQPRLVDRLMGQLPGRDAKVLRRRMERIGPVRLADIEQAQQHLALIATRLTKTGQLTISAKRRLMVAA